MRVDSLIIDRPNNYSNEVFPLRGKITLKSSTGEQTIALGAGVMNQIFRIIALECGATAKRDANTVQPAILAAGDEVIFIENDGQLLLGDAK